MTKSIKRPQTFAEELVNSITHAIGIPLGIVGLVVLIINANNYGDAWHIFSVSVFGASMIFLYTASTIYHSTSKVRLKFKLNIIDHSAIFILIAGTYTPFTLVTLRGAWGWSIFGVVWGLAIIGVVTKILFINRYRKVTAYLYLAMGWIIVIALKPLINALPAGGLYLLIAGGLSYSAGIIFYQWKRLPFAHAIFHLFVLGGTVCHFFAVLLYVTV